MGVDHEGTTYIHTGLERRRPPGNQPGGVCERFRIKGRCQSRTGERQVCVITREGRDAVNADHRDGLCFRRFKETLELDEATESELKPGAEFDIGPVRFRVSQAKNAALKTAQSYAPDRSAPFPARSAT
jgi:hypothetical protein